MIGALVARKSVAGSFDALNRHDLERFMSARRDDGQFVYPGDIPESGTFHGKDAVKRWFQRFFDQFPTIQFDIRDLCVRDPLDLLGTNVIAAHWNVRLVNRDGRQGENSGVTLISIERGKVFLVKDVLFELGDNFRQNWGAASVSGREDR